MKKDDQPSRQGMTRRSFIGAAATAAASMGLGLVGCSQDDQRGDPSGPKGGSLDWSGEADVIVMGFGGAGGTAAIEAARQGAHVMLFEKAPEEFAGGNSSVCEGASVIAGDREAAFELTRRLTDESSVTDAELYSFIDNNMKEVEWFKEALGMDCSTMDYDKEKASWGRFKSGEAFSSFTINPTFYMNVKDAVKKMSDDIEVFYESPVVDLVVNRETGEIQGVAVDDGSGESKLYKAKRGVVMACGSFEANPYMIEQYCYDPLPELYPMGSPYNTGDGIPIVQKVGARLRHMAGLEFGAYCFRQPTRELGCTVAMNNNWEDLDHVIAINKSGRRFMDEAARTQTGSKPHPCHDKATLRELDYDGINFEYANLPFWLVFDSNRCSSHALGTWASSAASSGWTARHGLYSWSGDNQEEISKGWIVEAETIAELAEKIGVDASELEATVAAYNASCESGQDEFGRIENLTPIKNAPFYACETVLSFINAQGGPQRNENYQVVGYDGEPIPRLFAAGEFGSIWGHDYHGGLNVPEAMCGFAAGASVASVEPWE